MCVIVLKLVGIGIVDCNIVVGVVWVYDVLECVKKGLLGMMLLFFDFKLVVGVWFVFVDGMLDIVVYVVICVGWGWLIWLLMFGNWCVEKGGCIFGFDDLIVYLGDILLIVMLDCIV